jgi:hypothetical protein
MDTAEGFNASSSSMARPRVHTPAQLFWRDTAFALANIYLAALTLWLDWPWLLEAAIYLGVMLLLRPLVLRSDDTVTRLNIIYALGLGLISWYITPWSFGSPGRPGPLLDSASGWPIWAALPGLCFVVFNGLTYRIKVYRAWPHPLCVPLLILMGIAAMWEMHHVLDSRGFGFNLLGQLTFWGLWAIPLLHDRLIHPRGRNWT